MYNREAVSIIEMYYEESFENCARNSNAIRADLSVVMSDLSLPSEITDLPEKQFQPN